MTPQQLRESALLVRSGGSLSTQDDRDDGDEDIYIWRCRLAENANLKPTPRLAVVQPLDVRVLCIFVEGVLLVGLLNRV
jgi:hypothetical protein